MQINANSSVFGHSWVSAEQPQRPSRPIPAVPAVADSCPCLSQFRSVQSLSRVQLFAILWTTARQASLSITNSWSPPKPMSIESVMPSSHLILCRPLLVLPSIFLRIKVLSNDSAVCIMWPKYWSFSSQSLLKEVSTF